jgi:hypothetical protein
MDKLFALVVVGAGVDFVMGGTVVGQVFDVVAGFGLHAGVVGVAGVFILMVFGAILFGGASRSAMPDLCPACGKYECVGECTVDFGNEAFYNGTLNTTLDPNYDDSNDVTKYGVHESMLQEEPLCCADCGMLYSGFDVCPTCGSAKTEALIGAYSLEVDEYAKACAFRKWQIDFLTSLIDDKWMANWTLEVAVCRVVYDLEWGVFTALEAVFDSTLAFPEDVLF